MKNLNLRIFEKLSPNEGKLMLNTMKSLKYTGLIISLFIFGSVVLLNQDMLVNKVSAQKAETQKLPNLNRDKTSEYFPQNGNIDLFNNENQLLPPIQNEIRTGSLDSKISRNGFDYKAAKNLRGTVPGKFDFDGDGKTDISIFRPDSGQWWIIRSSDGNTTTVQAGSSSHMLIPGNFLGNQSTEIAALSISSSAQLTQIVTTRVCEKGISLFGFDIDWKCHTVVFSIADDGSVTQLNLAVKDFNGDTMDDLGIYNPSNSKWTVVHSSDGSTTITQFGLSTDKPVAADYDGDGKADIAVFRPSNGQWWIKRSIDGTIRVIQLGVSTDRPVQADYTGDGKADIAVWRPSTGEWLVMRSEDNSFYGFQFGSNGDVPVPGDYDGDGKNDAAVFRPSNNVWYISRSTGGFQVTQFGTSGDVPVPSVYVP